MEKRKPITNNKDLYECIERVRRAQRELSHFTQEEVDRIFYAAALAANKKRIELSWLVARETKMGVAEDKVIKNHYAAEYIYNAYKDTQTCGIIEEDEGRGLIKIAEPVGVIAAIVPTTNPTSTVIFKTLISLKTRNGIIITPHPRAKKCSCEAARIIYEAAVEAGAPEGIIEWVDEPTIELTNALMRESDLILATGGQNMVRSAYSSGKPAIGVGSGNTPVIIDTSADIELAVSSIILSKSFDNGLICASEQAAVVTNDIYDAVKHEFGKRGAYILNNEERDKLRAVMAKEDGHLNPAVVGQSACRIAGLAEIEVDRDTRILIAETEEISREEIYSLEKLSPVLALYRASDFEDALCKAEKLLSLGGVGHTSSLYIDEKREENKLKQFAHRLKTCRVLINTPSSHGAVGDLYNSSLAPSLTLGCGSWGGNSVCENVGVKQLMNIKTVAKRRENMLWLRVPPRVYLERGCLKSALTALIRTNNARKIFVVTDSFLYSNGMLAPVTELLRSLDCEYSVYSQVEPDPTLSSAVKGASIMGDFEPDMIIAFGGGSAIDCAKVMWTLYEYPDADFGSMSMPFADIRKRIYEYPESGIKSVFCAVPTTAGTGSEVTPFAVITDDTSGVKYPLADYALMPTAAVIDPQMTDSSPKSLTAASGIDALTHALEAYASMLATDYTDALALRAIKMIFEYLPRAYDNGEADILARDKMSDAAAMAGIAFANAFLGICHSMAHKLGAAFSLPHGVANALLIEEVMCFNASQRPLKMGSFPQYTHPNALKRYAEIADTLGITGCDDTERLEGLLNMISELKSRVGIKRSISDYGISEEAFEARLDEMSYRAFDDQCTGANPRYPLVEEIKEIYRKAFRD